tara:strand:+ start:778 stop:987 length:210 start_codon:yes stop_codon:yes gene_type:complete
MNNPTIAQLASIAGTKAELSKALGVCSRTIANWRSGEVSKVPFVAVAMMAERANVKLDDIKIEQSKPAR